MRQEFVDFEEVKESAEFWQEAMDEDKGDLAQPEQFSPKVRMNVSEGVYSKTLHTILPLKYARGDELSSLGGELDDLLHYRRLQKAYADALPEEDQGARVQWEHLTHSRLKAGLYWMAWALCLQRDAAYIHEAMALLDNAGLDTLFDQVMVQLGDTDRPVAEQTLYPGEYVYRLLDIMHAAPAQRPALMKQYVDGWYAANRKDMGLDLYLTNPDTYTGYWCWEAALIVKLYAIDDSSFCDNVYYPANLVRGDLSASTGRSGRMTASRPSGSTKTVTVSTVRQTNQKGSEGF